MYCMLFTLTSDKVLVFICIDCCSQYLQTRSCYSYVLHVIYIDFRQGLGIHMNMFVVHSAFRRGLGIHMYCMVFTMPSDEVLVFICTTWCSQCLQTRSWYSYVLYVVHNVFRRGLGIYMYCMAFTMPSDKVLVFICTA
ncbi:hypothetical protein CHS0354_038845 [Potamilus streckersoni]|uniref:Uncharacterized protein n=1 Tax=Potamilus streckersoni TaxID=2493646 RepID=A0AAE0TGZ1_9BIVA|nr:hypothetical protein CHS0354_038845 [Potamilus streckersoni]